MKKFTKLIALLLVIATLIPAAVACKDNTQTTPSDTTTSAADDTGATPPENGESFVTPETITIEKKDTALNYEITRPQNASADAFETKAMQQVLMYLSEKTGAVPSVATDWAEEEDSEKLEIIVGATDHPETDVLLDSMSYGDYGVQAVGNKLVLVAFDKEGYDKAIEHLKSVLDKGYDATAKTITVNTSELTKVEKTNEQLAALPVYEGGRYYTTYDAGRVTATTECDQIIVKSTNAEEYDEYLEKLEAKGYTQYTTNDIGENKFAIYTNSKYTLNVGYYDYEKSARLLVEPKGALPTRPEDNKTEKVTDSQITMMAVSGSHGGNGLSTLIRLEDGRFIVIDGGFSQALPDFIKTIKAQSSEYTKKPVVAAWIITHGHGDHSQLLASNALAIKQSGILIERILLNEISMEESRKSAEAFKAAQEGTLSGTYNFTEGEGNWSTGPIIEQIAPAFDADLYKLHIGQSFNISNVKMDVVYTVEGYAPKVCNAYNGTSNVIKMTFTDSATGKVTTFLSTGDATGFAMQTAANIFKDYIKCDIISVPHHGATTWGGNNEMIDTYKRVSPTLLLWPVGNSSRADVSQRAYNQILFQNASFKEVYYAGDIGDGNTVVPLPYVVGNVLRVKY